MRVLHLSHVNRFDENLRWSEKWVQRNWKGRKPMNASWWKSNNDALAKLKGNAANL